jgi:asparagine synthase (glutamine-hydrolysing)
MCGICGTTAVGDGAALAAMSAALMHRGPDDRGEYIDRERNVGLAARRLSIIDIEGGHQPLSNEDGSVWAVCNGEIYNYRTLREHLLRRGHEVRTHCDTEVLVHLYEDHGPDLAHALEGMYAFAIWDVKREQMLLCRDRFGEKPLFYTEESPELVFASEVSALLVGFNRDWQLDASAVDTFFTFGYVRGPDSIVRGVHELAPGSWLAWRRGMDSKIERYWRLPEGPPNSNGRARELVAETRDLLERSVRSRLNADVPVGVFLSGGIDSSLVARLAAQQSRGRLQTFTVGYEQRREDERAPARRIANLLGSEHHELILTDGDVATSVPSFLAELDQPLADEAFVPLRALSHFARPSITVAVGGEGADELFGGYPRYRWLVRSTRIPTWVPRKLLGSAVGSLGTIWQDTRVSRLHDVIRPLPAVGRHLRWVTGGRIDMRGHLYGQRLREVLERPSEATRHERVETAGTAELVARKFMHLDTTEWLPYDVLAKADRASMRASLEFRTPYLHRELAEFAASVPASLHLRDGGKFLLREALRESEGPPLENRRKVAFHAPVAQWLRSPLAAALEEHLTASTIYSHDWFDRQAVARIVAAHRSGARDWSAVIWPIFVLGTWLDQHPRLHG